MEQNTRDKVGLFAFPGGRQIPSLIAQIETLQAGSVEWFDLSMHPDAAYFIDHQAVGWNGCDLSKLKSAYLHGFAYQFPVIPRYQHNTDTSVWQVNHIIDQQKFSFLSSLFQDIERRGVLTVNSFRNHINGFMRFECLESIRRAGFAVPALLCSNDMQQAEIFCAQHAHPVWRPSTGRAIWQLFDERRQKAPLTPEEPPVIIAETREGPMLRAYIIGGQTVLFLGMKQPDSSPPLESLEIFWQRDENKLVQVFNRLSQQLAIPMMLVTFVLQEDTAWIYDVDLDPVFDNLPEELRSYLIECLALSLLDRSSEIQPLERVGQTLNRPNFFSRGLLCILFNMERIRRRQKKKD